MRRLYEVPRGNNQLSFAFAEVELMGLISIQYRLYFYNMVLFPEM